MTRFRSARWTKARPAVLFSLLLVPCAAETRQPAGGPSVVLVTIDTLRADRLPAYGYPRGKTPAIDALAAEGVLFEKAYVQTPITLPSHASILTGTYPMHHKLQDVVGRLRDGVPTLATIFKQAGYKTGAFVGSTVLSSRWLLNRGFDTYDDFFRVAEGLRQVDFDRIERSADDVLAPAVEWLGTAAKGPFFLWVHFYDPHDPYTPPAPFSAEFRERPYDGEIAYVDTALAKLVEKLKELGVYEPSLIVLTADHGESLGEHQEVHHGFFVYDASLRVPLVLKLPGGRSKATRVPNAVRSIDLAPSILQYANLRVPASMQGESLVGMVAGKRTGVELPVYAETHYPRVHFNWSALFSYQSGKFKYIEAPNAELYDLERDPGEVTNIAAPNQALAGKLKGELASLQQRYSSSVAVTDPTANLDPETVSRLKSLGYVTFAASSQAKSGRSLPDPKEKIGIYNQLNRGIAFSRRGMPERAIDTFSQVVKLEPQMPIAHFLLGMEYFENRWYLKAMEEFKETLKHNPSSNVAMFNLARSYLESGQTEQAEVGFKHLLEREPEHFAARHYLSLTYSRRARYEEAVEEELKALRTRPDYIEGYNNIGSFYLNLAQVDKAIEAYQKALSLAPGFVMAKVNLALAYLKKGDYDRAIDQSRDVVAKDPRRTLAHYYLGQAYLGKGMKQEAREAFQKAKELDPRLNVPAIP